MTTGSGVPAAAAGGWRVPFVRPDMPPPETVAPQLEAVLSRGQLTKGQELTAFEAEAAAVAGTADAVGVSSCTVGLTLVVRLLAALSSESHRCAACPTTAACPRGAAASGRDEVILPSFTFLAAPAAVVWAGLRPRFVDVRPDDFTLDPVLVAAAITPRTAAILGCHVFGCGCDVPALQEIAAAAGIPLVIDAAHALGTTSGGVQVGAGGLAEVFSLSPTKLVVAGEGGLVTTSCGCLAALLRQAREYGNDGSYGSRLPGLNARLPELSAVVGRASLARLPEVAARRSAAAAAYIRGLAGLPGLGFQQIPSGIRSSWKDFVVAVDPDVWPGGRDRLRQELAAVGIDTRAYYSPACHQMEAYAGFLEPGERLPVTDRLAATLVALPLGGHVTPDVATTVATAVRTILTGMA